MIRDVDGRTACDLRRDEDRYPSNLPDFGHAGQILPHVAIYGYRREGRQPWALCRISDGRSRHSPHTGEMHLDHNQFDNFRHTEERYGPQRVFYCVGGCGAERQNGQVELI